MWQLNILYLIFWILFFITCVQCIWRCLESSNHVYLDFIYLYSLKCFEISEGFFFSVLFNWGNKVFNWIQVIIMYNIYPERHLPDFKLILQGGGGVEVTFCIVNDFVTWKEVKISYVKSNGNYLLNCRFLSIETKMSTCQYMCIINV